MKKESKKFVKHEINILTEYEWCVDQIEKVEGNFNKIPSAALSLVDSRIWSVALENFAENKRNEIEHMEA